MCQICTKTLSSALSSCFHLQLLTAVQRNVSCPWLLPISGTFHEEISHFFISLNSNVKHSYSDFLHKPYEQMIKYDALLQIKGPFFHPSTCFQLCGLLKMFRLELCKSSAGIYGRLPAWIKGPNRNRSMQTRVCTLGFVYHHQGAVSEICG